MTNRSSVGWMTNGDQIFTRIARFLGSANRLATCPRRLYESVQL